jgi:hypothetical protein
MKNLANCKPREFLQQTNRIRKAVEKWLKLTDIMKIRNNVPKIPKGTSTVEANKLLAEAAQKNLSRMLDVIMDEHPDETLELLALCCFVEPENVDDYEVADYLGSFADIIQNEAVLRFFTSLMQLGQMNTSAD